MKRNLPSALLTACLLAAAPALVAPQAHAAPEAPSSADRPSRADMLQQMRAIVADKLSIDPKRVTDDARFCEDLGADSLDEVEIVMAFEDAFHVPIPDDAVAHIHTIAAAALYVSAHTAGH